MTKGICECGCEGKTNIILRNNKKYNRKKGEYSKFISGHHFKEYKGERNTAKRPEIREKISIDAKKRWSDKTKREKQSKVLSNYYKNNVHHNKGKPKNEETKRKMAETRRKWYLNNQEKCILKSKKCSETKKLEGTSKLERNNMWKGGISFEPYTKEFNKDFKEAIRLRDNFACLKCNLSEEDHKKIYRTVLNVHHINYDKKLSIKENCCSLCTRCNSEVNINRIHWTKFFQSLLFERYEYNYDNGIIVIKNKMESENKWEQ